MVLSVLSGIVLGILVAYAVDCKKRKFRRFLVSDYERSCHPQGAIGFARGLLERREQWKKSISPIRKPFNKHVNLAIETAALIYALVGLANTITDFNRHYDSFSQGATALVTLSFVIAFIPAEWVLAWRTDKEIDSVLDEIGRAMDSNRVDLYFAEVKESWR